MAKHLGLSNATVSRIEAGDRLASMPEATGWARAAGASAETLERLLADVEAVYSEIETYRSNLSSTDQLETRATSIESAQVVRSFTTSVVPGLMQTAEYARRNIELGLIGKGRDIPAVVAERMQRQRLLYEPDRSFTFLMTEHALRWPVGPPEIMKAQRDHIVGTIGLENVHIGVVPLNHRPEAREAHAFGIYESANQIFVHIELAHGMVTLTDPDDVATYSDLWQRISQSALFDADAARFIRALE
jgi:hypothetical protein